MVGISPTLLVIYALHPRRLPARGAYRDINQHNLPFAAWTDAFAILASPARLKAYFAFLKSG